MLLRALRHRRTRRVAPILAAFGLVVGVAACWPTSDAAAAATFAPAADTYVDIDDPFDSFGTATTFSVDDEKRSFLRFTVSGITGAITSAKLRLHVGTGLTAGSDQGGTVSRVASNTWSETMSFIFGQPTVGASLGSVGGVSRNTWYEVDVAAYVTGNGTYSFALTSTSGNTATYDSREGGAATAPQLVINGGSTTTSSTAPPTTQPPTTPPPTTGPPTTPPPTTGPPTTPPPTTVPPTTQPPSSAVLVGAGDIAACGGFPPGDGGAATAALLDNIPGQVFTAGDNAYPNGSDADYANCYNPSWGRQKARTHPSPGNHEYQTPGAAGYYNYFGALAGPAGRGYYSYDLGNWHVVSLNSNCSSITGGCGAGGAQEQWLRQDLAASTKPCTIAYWHHPFYSSGQIHGRSLEMQALWQALYDNNAEVVVSGHEHQYERFAPQNANSGLDNARGIRQFVVGTGGAILYAGATPIANSEVRNGNTNGVIKFTLNANGYAWQFVPVAGQSFTDSGTGTCH
jgi:acid phosphatase type 7